MPQITINRKSDEKNGVTKYMKENISLKKKKPTMESFFLSVDFPQEGEKICSPDYAIRLSAPENSQVEIAMNDNDWKPCRWAVGYWWYDWAPLQSGTNEIIARSRTNKSKKWQKSKKRICEVETAS